MRIAYVIPVFPEIHNTFVLNQITGMIDRGHEVDLYPLEVGDYDHAQRDVAAYDLRSRVVHLPIPHDRLARATKAAALLLRPASWRRSVVGALDPRRGQRTWSLVPLYTALSFVGREPYHAVHVQFGHLGPEVARLVAARGVAGALVTSFRGADATSHLPRHPAAYRQLFRVGDAFLPVSEDLRTRVIASGAPAERTFVHHSGIDVGRFAFTRRGLGSGEAARLLFVGRLVEKKGVRYLLEALALLAGTAHVAEDATAEAGGAVVAGGADVAATLGTQASTPPGAHDATLTVIGDGPERQELEATAERLHVASRVRFLGTLGHDQVREAMAAAHVLVAPSVTAASGDREGIPNVLKEAMATGLPVLATHHGGIAELVADGVSGYLVPERDAPALAARLRDLLARPDRMAQMGEAGRRAVEEGFDITRLNEVLERRYREAHATWAARSR